MTDSPFRILLIDDDRIQARLLSLRLERQGYELLVSHSGAEGLELARTSQPALILCDWMMEGMDGLEVCRRLKGDSSLAATYFILLTSRSDLEDRVVGLDAGADDFLSKPVEAEELLARVRSGLRLYQANLNLTRLAQDLQRQQAALEAELAEAAAYVVSQLPPPLVEGPLRVDARFRPSLQLGGDGFDYFWIDENHLLIHMIDVSGHGLAAALPSVSVLNRLRSRSLAVDLTRPEQVLEALNRDFQMEQHHDRYFTIWCGVYGRQSRELRYCSAGHPPAVLLPPPGAGPISTLGTRGMAIGLFEEATYLSLSCSIEAGSTLLVISDGIYELPGSDGVMGSLEQFLSQLSPEQLRQDEALDELMAAARARTSTGRFTDDVSLLRVRFS